MKIIHRGRQEGKTHDLIHECANDPIGLLVVHNYATVRAMQEIARHMGLTITEPITYQQLIDGTALIGRRVRLYIDNVDMLIQRLAGPVPVELVTFNRHYELDLEDTSED